MEEERSHGNKKVQEEPVQDLFVLLFGEEEAKPMVLSSEALLLISIRKCLVIFRVSF